MDKQGSFDEEGFPEAKSVKSKAKDQSPKVSIDLKEKLRPGKSVQIAAAGTVLLTKLETEVVDTQAFQRLRRIKQLGAAYLVYPTAVHTRFDHSLGALQMASEMIQRVRENIHSTPLQSQISDEQEIVIRLYALLHDVTHVPFGHTIEDELRLLGRHDKNVDRINFFLGPDSEIGRVIRRNLPGHIVDRLLEVVLHETVGEEGSALPPDWFFVHEIVSNTVCADLLDYLRRDDYFCDLGVSMRYRFLNFLYIHGTGTHEDPRRLAIRLYKNSNMPRRDTLSDLCRLLESRYTIAERVYFHHAKLAAGSMLGVAIQAHAAQEGKGQSALESEMRLLGDDELLAVLTKSKNVEAAEVANAFVSRKLYKTLESITKEEVRRAQSEAGEHGHDLMKTISDLSENPELRRTIVAKYAAIIGCPKHYLAIYVPPEEMGRKLAEMQVYWDGSLRPLRAIEDDHVKPRLEAVLAAHKRLWSISLIGHPSFRNTKKADWLGRLFRADFVSSTKEEGNSVRSSVLREIGEEVLGEKFAGHSVDASKIPILLDKMVLASQAAYHGGTEDIRAIMFEEAKGFLGVK